MRFLVTRPQPECSRTADRIRAKGYDADEAPMLVFCPKPPEKFDLSNVSALAVTSRRAIDVIADHAQAEDFRQFPVFTVGDTTAAASKSAGFGTIFSAGGDVASLAKLIVSKHMQIGTGTVLYPAAQDRSGDLEEVLAQANIECRTVPVYKMNEAVDFPGRVEERLRAGSYDGVLIYSKRTAATLMHLLGQRGLDHIISNLRIYAISQQAAEPLSDYMKVEVAEDPCENALLELALGEC
ncbi:uroporphyrinogen-III synthase [Roseibium sp. HPY-6]|uniref:uroporphyrinogen-III synthase n=1 Tax=Roseibium sp. HPY-6 TaxID=3229852 RepID=UPI0033905296